MTNKLTQRFQELEEQLKQVEATKRFEADALTDHPRPQVDRQLLLGWEVKTKNLLEKACGLESQHFQYFEAARKGNFTSWGTIEKLGAVFRAAKEDYEGGYCATVRNLAQAEVFDSELEQASAFLSLGYKVPSAVIAGTVLETSLRELCDRAGIAHGTLDRMNADLTKAGVYNANMSKRVVALAAIRNSAAHGKPQEFQDGDVNGMIEDVERFLSQYL